MSDKIDKMQEDKQDWRLPEGFQWDDDAGPSPKERMQEAIAEMESAIAELRKPVTTAPIYQMVEAAEHIWKAQEVLQIPLDDNGMGFHKDKK